uniref:Uncharacterized protein n=1 Tax=Malurus cyaneus samueli TaxID=2593467 RepID=A0A8C5T530_9PASS
MWYLVFYCAFQTLVTCFHVPYSALTMFISREQSERDSATAYRMTVEVLGTVLGTAIQGQIVGKVDTPCIESPFFLGLTNSSVAMEELNMTHDTGSLTDTRNAYMIAAGVIGGLYFLCFLILVLGVREKRESSELQSDEPVSFFQGLKLVMNHGPYIKLIAGFLFTSLPSSLLEGNFALFCTYTLGFRNEFQNILLAIMVALGHLDHSHIWQWFLTTVLGKKKALLMPPAVQGCSSCPSPSAIPSLAVVVLDSNLIVTYVVAVAAGISVAAAFLLPWSMLPDVIDDFKLQHPSLHGQRIFPFLTSSSQFTRGLPWGIPRSALEGPAQASCNPIFLCLKRLCCFKLYPIDEEKRRKNKKALQDLR